MATTASSRAPNASAVRRSPSGGVSSTSMPASSIHRGATARSAVSPRVSASLTAPAGRRGSIKSSAPPVLNGGSRESLSASLKEETEKKEQLLVQLQDKDQTITTLTTESNNLSSALNAAEGRLAELYADQNRMEEEMAARIEVIEKLRTQVRDLEKEKRDIQRRYNEQTATFEAERQAFYDNEQHLKSRIQSLTQARKQPVQPILSSPSSVSIAESETTLEEVELPEPPEPAKQDLSDPEQEPAEMTALKLELSTLSTSYGSLQSTLVLLQTQLNDLKRVNNELQEENESYNILLREKTLNGQFDVLRMGGTTEPSESSEDEGEIRDAESFRSRNTTRSILEPVDELAEEQAHEQEEQKLTEEQELQQVPKQEQEHELDPEFEQQDLVSHAPESPAKAPRRNGRRRAASTSHSPAPRGESLANLPITGPGLDLAAELGRAENKDILEGRTALDTDRSLLNPTTKSRKGRKSSTSETGRKVSSASEPALETGASSNDVDALRSEVKSLKDANKALSLYASKIIDRIISQSGFEHVLAVDYEKQAPSPGPTAVATTFDNIPKSPNPAAAQPAKKGRPQSAIFSFSSSSSPASTSTAFSPPQERLTTFDDLRAAPSPPAPSTRSSRRSMSFDWKSFSMFGGGDKEKKPEPSAHLRPLTLRAGTNPVVTGARKLDTLEDEEDRRERERLHATMKLMGIDKPVSPAVPAMGKSYTSPAPTVDLSGSRTPLYTGTFTPGTAVPSSAVSSPAPSTARFSFFRRNSSLTPSETPSAQTSVYGSSLPSGSRGTTPDLTQEALAQAEAENTIAALDAHERQLSAEIAKGAGSGFTEIVRRSGDRRSSRRSGESGSTVWSAGMSKAGDASD